MGSTWISFEEACHRYHEKRSRAKGLAEGRAKGLSEGREQGLSEGREQGREQGREEGRRMARIGLLLRQLETRFGVAAARRLRARLDKATESQLERWAIRLLLAPTLEAVFGRSSLAQRSMARARVRPRKAATGRKRRRMR